MNFPSLSVQSIGTAPAGNASARLFYVNQKAGEKGSTVGLGRSFAAKPVELLLGGKTYAVKELDAFWVWVPKLADGVHHAALKLANGELLPIMLRAITRS